MLDILVLAVLVFPKIASVVLGGGGVCLDGVGP